ncbi:MAG: diguanylate cyclase [Frankiales bacterium]|nr:diguanylate cyclase [Frankiales bacterium]
MPPRILLADDSATVRAIARMDLETAGYEVTEAVDGQEALKLAFDHPPDVVLLDVEMPIMDGYQTIRALKADPRTANIPVVFLTGRAGAEDVAKALQLGGHDYVRKPPEATELLARVASALRVKQLQDELRSRADELERVSRTDHLTGLHNRRHMSEHLRRMGAGAKRHGYPFAVLLVDVDHFKAVNDQLGHQVGDEVLIEVAERLRQSLRIEDVVGRWGGEEFLILLPFTACAAANVLGERLRAIVGNTPVVSSGGNVSVTISIGGAAAEAAGEHDLLLLADQQLYAAKGAGRDRSLVVLSPPA